MEKDKLIEILDKTIARLEGELEMLEQASRVAKDKGNQLESDFYWNNATFVAGKLKAFEEVRCFIG